MPAVTDSNRVEAEARAAERRQRLLEDGGGEDIAAAATSAASPSPSSAATPTAAVPPAGFCSLFRYASGSDRMLLFLGVLGAIGQGCSGPALSFFMKDLFQALFLPNDNGSQPPHASGPHHHRDEKVMTNLWTFLIVGLVTFVASYSAYACFARVADNITLQLKTRFFDELLKKPVSWYDEHDATVMATRLTNDTYEFRQGVGEKLAQFLQGIIMVPASFVIAFIHDWRLTAMLFACIPIMGCTFGFAGAQMGKANSSQQEFYAAAGGQAEIALSGIRTVAAFGGFDREIHKYDDLIDSAAKKGVRVGWCNALALGFAQLVVYGTFAVGLLAGSWLVIRDFDNNCWESNPPFGDCFTGATMIATLFAVLYGGIGLSTMGPGLTTLTSAKSAAGRIYAIIDEELPFDAEAGEVLPEVAGTVEFKDVVFCYPTRPDTHALSHASFKVTAGQTAAFVGPSGSGKSTTISLLQRFYDPLSGSIEVDGHDIRTLNLTWLRSRMSLVQQEPVLFSGSILDNIGYGSLVPVTPEAVEAAAKASNAHSFITHFPRKYATEVGERGTQLSGGQKQRIAIARAMVRDPAILLLDEATSALDSESERIVQQALDDLLKQKARTTFVVAHRLTTIRSADIICVLENGRLLEQGTHSQLIEKGGLYSQLVQLQNIHDAEEEEEEKRERALSQGDDQLPPSDQDPTAAGSAAEHHRPRLPSGGSRPGSSAPSPAKRLVRQTSHESAGATSNAQSVHEEIGEVPPEDDVNVNVPIGRLWAMQRPELLWVLVALISTGPVGTGRPLMGFLLSDTSTLFSQPPAVKLPDGTWVPALDTDTMREKSNRQCIEFACLGVMMCFAVLGQFGGFRLVSEKLTRRIRHETFTAMLRQEMGWFDKRTSGDLANRLASEAMLIKSFTGESLASVIQLLFCLGCGLGIAFYTSWQLTLTTIIFMPIIMAGSVVLIKTMRQKNETEAGPLVSQAMGNIKTVASFSLRSKMMKRYTSLLEDEGHIEAAKSGATAFASAYFSAISFVMFGLVTFIGNIFLSHGIVKPGDVLQVLFTVMFAATGAGIVSQWQGDKVKGQQALNHIFHTLDREPIIDAYATTGTKLEKVVGSVEFRHVQFSYPTRPDIVVFSDFDLKIEPNTTVAFCGPSGSGKSTTIALLQRFYNPTGGSVCLDGHDISTLNLTWLRNQMALVQQEPVLFAGSILENIRYGRESATDEECIAAAKAANAHNFIAAMENKYQTDVGDRGGQLSGGQKQRVAIARSMVRDPAVLLLDEATSALDTESERVVQEALDKLLAESSRTTLVIAHRLSTIVNSDVICVIYQGKIVEKGSHSELMKIPDGQYKQLASRDQKSKA